MLTELRVRNFAIIEQLSLPLARGFNVLSGETGAGKSIIVGALGLLLGERASTDLIRTGTDRATVEGVFDIAQLMYNVGWDVLAFDEADGNAPEDIPLIEAVNAEKQRLVEADGAGCRLLQAGDHLQQRARGHARRARTVSKRLAARGEHPRAPACAPARRGRARG